MGAVLTNAGAAVGTGLISQITSLVPKYIGWGTGAGAAAVGDTVLSTEAAEARVAGTVTRVTTTVANDTLQVVGTLTSASNQTITNVGTFDAATAGNLFVHADGVATALNINDAIQFTIKTVLIPG